MEHPDDGAQAKKRYINTVRRSLSSLNIGARTSLGSTGPWHLRVWYIISYIILQARRLSLEPKHIDVRRQIHEVSKAKLQLQESREMADQALVYRSTLRSQIRNDIRDSNERRGKPRNPERPGKTIRLAERRREEA